MQMMEGIRRLHLPCAVQDPLPPHAVKLTLEFEGCESRNLHCYYEPIWGGPCVETFKKEREAAHSAVQMV